MGIKSKKKKRTRFISAKPIKQWCKARGLDWRKYLDKCGVKHS